jgi:excisionase family DNA binding protein
MSAIADTLLTKKDVAGRLNVSVATVERLVARGKLPCVDMGYRTKRFRPADLDRLQARLAGDTQPRTWL